MNVATVNERNARKRNVRAAADVLELSGNVALADQLRNNHDMHVHELGPSDQGAVDEIAGRNDDISRERIVNIMKVRQGMVVITVGNREVLVERSVAQRVRDLLSIDIL